MKDNLNFLGTETKIDKEPVSCICKHCGRVLDINDSIETRSKDRICYECYNAQYITCGICSQVIGGNNLKNLHYGNETLEVCEDCYAK